MAYPIASAQRKLAAVTILNKLSVGQHEIPSTFNCLEIGPTHRNAIYKLMSQSECRSVLKRINPNGSTRQIPNIILF